MDNKLLFCSDSFFLQLRIKLADIINYTINFEVSNSAEFWAIVFPLTCLIFLTVHIAFSLTICPNRSKIVPTK